MPVEILMPELGESVHEGTVSRWLKREGEYVKEDEPVVEIMTDKVNTELQAPASGILVKILIPEGSPVEVFKPMGLIEETSTVPTAGPEPPAPPPSAFESVVQSGPTAALAESPSIDKRRWFTPVVRSIAAQHGITDAELEQIPGTGDGGRVTKKDVEKYLGARKSIPVPGAAAPMTTTKLEAVPGKAPAAGPEQELIALVGMRKMIADAMVRSSQVPVVSTVTEVDVTNMVLFRNGNKDTFQSQFGVKLTYTPFFIKAVTEALIEFPLLNASLREDGHVLMNHAVHMGVAVSLGKKGDEGLIVPVIRDCHLKSLVDVAKDLEVIAAKARSGQLAVSDVQGGTFTLTNPGSYGALLGTPMINAPQAGILGTYTIKKMPVIVDDMIAVRSIMNLVLTYDHRIVDGMLAGRFLQSVKAKLEGFAFFR